MTVMSLPATPWTNGQTTTDGRFYYDSAAGGVGAWRSTPLPVGGLPAGSIMAWGTNTPPANWLLADGSAVSRSVYSSLFAVIGTQYGTGDGSTTFNLPDLRGRVPVGKNGADTSFDVLGETGGAKTHAHGSSSMIAGLNIFRAGSENYWDYFERGGGFTENSRAYVTSSGGVVGGRSEGAGSGIGIFGDTDAGSNLSPYIVVNYIIKASAGWTAGDSELATRVGALETADATTNKSGLVPVIPTSVSVGSGSASISSAGVVTFSGVSSLSFNGIFSSSYRNYLVIFDWLNTTDSGLFIRLRSGTTDNTSAVYSYNMLWQGSAGVGNSYQNAVSAFGGIFGHARQSVKVDVISPYEARRTAMIMTGNAENLSGSTEAHNSSATHRADSSFDGLTLYQASGNGSGVVRIYGYR